MVWRSSICVMVGVSVLGCNGDAALQTDGDVDPRPPSVERGLVAMGVARLSARHVAAVLKAIDADATCGFASPDAKASLQLSGQPGDDGTATWSVSHCRLAFDPEQKLDTDCDGAEVWASGGAIVSAVRTVRGGLTKDLDQPIAPDAADAASVEL